MIIQHHITEDGAGLRGIGTPVRRTRVEPRPGQDVPIIGKTGEVAGAAGASAAPTVRIRQLQLVQDGLGAAATRAQTQLGYLDELDATLSRMTGLGRQAAVPTLPGPDRERVRDEFGRLAQRVEDLSTRRLNGEPLFDGSVREVPLDTTGRTVSLSAPAFDRPVYEELRTARVDTPELAAEAVKLLEAATSALAEDRARLKTGHEALLRAGETLEIEQENLAAATVRLRDAGQAELVVRQLSARFLVQSSEALRAQGHVQPDRTLPLLQ
ncbi:MAG: hypothetical protein N2438_12205 [Limisphaera sp.]|nr:hypothetical protein [Limisphaera sp.]